MILKKSVRRLLLLLMLTSCAGICNAQQVKIVEKLNNGEFIVSIDGVEQRTITASHAREIEMRKVELEALKAEKENLLRQIDLLKQNVELAKKDAQLADAQRALEQAQKEKFQAIYEGEQKLRLQCEKLNNRGRVTTFFDHPITQIITKIGLPLTITWLSARK